MFQETGKVETKVGVTTEGFEKEVVLDLDLR